MVESGEGVKSEEEAKPGKTKPEDEVNPHTITYIPTHNTANQPTQQPKPNPKRRPTLQDDSQHYIAEYLIYGTLNTTACATTISLSTLEENGLYTLMPELEAAGGFYQTGYAPHFPFPLPSKTNNSKNAPPTPKVPPRYKDPITGKWVQPPVPTKALGQGGEPLVSRVQKLREELFARGVAVSVAEVEVVKKVAGAFGEGWGFPVAVALLGLRMRDGRDVWFLGLVRGFGGMWFFGLWFWM